MGDDNLRHMKFLETVVAEDVRALRVKETTYQGSWKKRGGVGAFMMTARKWDRLENMVRGDFDVFAAIEKNVSGADGTVLAEIRDLRRYLTLIEAEMRARGAVAAAAEKAEIEHVYVDLSQPYRPGTPEDGGHHEIVTEKETVTEMVGDTFMIHEDAYQNLGPVGPILYDDWKPGSVHLLVPHLSQTQLFDLTVKHRDHEHRAWIDAVLSDLYYRDLGLGGGWVLRIENAPPDFRASWPHFNPEYNAHEITKQPSWARAMYRHDERAAKWIIKPEYVAWTETPGG